MRRGGGGYGRMELQGRIPPPPPHPPQKYIKNEKCGIVNEKVISWKNNMGVEKVTLISVCVCVCVWGFCLVLYL